MQTVLLAFLLQLLLAGQCPSYALSLPPKPQPVTVNVFLSTECPVSQQYTQRLTDLYRDFSGRNVVFRAYFPLSTDNEQTLKDFQRVYRLPFPLISDRKQRMAHRLQAGITPEVVVQRADGLIVYQGAIDDWFVGLGKRRPQPTRHYLRDALSALLSGKSVSPVRTEAVGCYIE